MWMHKRFEFSSFIFVFVVDVDGGTLNGFSG